MSRSESNHLYVMILIRYDYRAGFWGVMGNPCLGIIPVRTFTFLLYYFIFQFTVFIIFCTDWYLMRKWEKILG